MKQSATRLSTRSPSHPQLSTSPLSLYANSRKLESTSATSSPPPRKRQRREPSPCDDIADTGGALNSHPLNPSRRGRPGRRGRRNPETRARKLQKYVDSGGPHRAAMVIDNLTSKYCITPMPFCWLNTLRQKFTILHITPMSALASQKTASGSGKLFRGNTLMLVNQKTSLPFPPLPTRFLMSPHQSTSCGPTHIIPHTSFCVAFPSSPLEHRRYYWQPGTALRA